MILAVHAFESRVFDLRIDLRPSEYWRDLAFPDLPQVGATCQKVIAKLCRMVCGLIE